METRRLVQTRRAAAGQGWILHALAAVAVQVHRRDLRRVHLALRPQRRAVAAGGVGKRAGIAGLDADAARGAGVEGRRSDAADIDAPGIDRQSDCVGAIGRDVRAGADEGFGVLVENVDAHSSAHADLAGCQHADDFVDVGDVVGRQHDAAIRVHVTRATEGGCVRVIADECACFQVENMHAGVGSDADLADSHAGRDRDQALAGVRIDRDVAADIGHHTGANECIGVLGERAHIGTDARSDSAAGRQ